MAQNTITFGELRVCRIVQGGRGSLGSDWMVLLVEMVARCWTWYHAALIWYRSQPAPTIAGTISGRRWRTHSWDGCQGAVRVPTRIKIGLHTLAPSSNVAFLDDNSIKALNKMPLTSVVKSVFSHVLILTFLKQVLPFSALMHILGICLQWRRALPFPGVCKCKRTYRIFILLLIFAIRRMSVIAW